MFFYPVYLLLGYR